MDYQYYPTPSDLVTKAWALFKKPVVRLLEPSAGEGHLLSGIHQTEDQFIDSLKRFNKDLDPVERERMLYRWRSERSRYAAMLGSSLAAFNERNDAERPNNVREDVTMGYEDLKDRAWTRILRSSEVNKRLSQKGQKVLESQFETVKKLDFTISNIYGFLIGIINNQSTLNLEMALDVFDQVTYYHSDNAVWYKGWKSNDKHLTSARRMKTSRFILPRHYKGFGNSAQFETVRLLGDFDKVFAMMDGRDIVHKDENNPFIGLADLFSDPYDYERLCRGNRLSSDYFDVRYYPGAGTIHFFPRSKTLVDRLNRLVGRHRQWLPQDGERVPDAFWLQYEMAEKFAKDVEAKIKDDRACHRMNATWERDELSRVRAIQMVNSAVDTVLAEKGIDPVSVISKVETDMISLPLLVA